VKKSITEKNLPETVPAPRSLKPWERKFFWSLIFFELVVFIMVFPFYWIANGKYAVCATLLGFSLNILSCAGQWIADPPRVPLVKFSFLIAILGSGIVGGMDIVRNNFAQQIRDSIAANSNKIAKKMDVLASYGASDHRLSLHDEEDLVRCINMLANAKPSWHMKCRVSEAGRYTFTWLYNGEVEAFVDLTAQRASSMMPYVMARDFDTLLYGRAYDVKDPSYKDIWGPDKQLFNSSVAADEAQWLAESLRSLGVSNGKWEVDKKDKKIRVGLSCHVPSAGKVVTSEGPTANSALVLNEQDIRSLMLLNEMQASVQIIFFLRMSGITIADSVGDDMVRCWVRNGDRFDCVLK